MKVDLNQLKTDIEEELKFIEEKRQVLTRSLEQIQSVEKLVSFRREEGTDGKISLSRFPHFEKALEETAGDEQQAEPVSDDDEDEPKVRIDWIQAG
jgi:hypothetical protein